MYCLKNPAKYLYMLTYLQLVWESAGVSDASSGTAISGITITQGICSNEQHACDKVSHGDVCEWGAWSGWTDCRSVSRGGKSKRAKTDLCARFRSTLCKAPSVHCTGAAYQTNYSKHIYL